MFLIVQPSTAENGRNHSEVQILLIDSINIKVIFELHIFNQIQTIAVSWALEPIIKTIFQHVK